MSRHAVKSIANDNDPLNRPEGDAVGYRAMLRERELERRLQALEQKQIPEPAPPTINSKKKPQPKKGLILALSLCLIATLSTAYCFFSGLGLIPTVISLSAMVWSALLAAYLCTKHTETTSVISEFSIILATLSGMAIWVMTSAEWGISLSVVDGAAGFAALTAVICALLKSRFMLLISAIGGIIWLALSLSIPSINLISIWAYPLLAGFQLILARTRETKPSALLSLIGLHLWLFWILNEHFLSGDISMLHVAAFGLLIGMAHYRLGKAAGDANWTNANMHVVTGWVLAIAGALGLQQYWLGNTPELWQDVASHPFGTLSWQIVGVSCILLIGFSGLIRMKHRQMTSLAVLLNLGVAVAAAALFDQRATIMSFMPSTFNAPAMPLTGIIIGAAIFSSAIAMSINGIRRNSMVMMFTGLGVIAIELAILFRPEYWTAEAGVIFGFMLLTSLSLAAMFAAEAEKGSA